jgi:large subunit ribosomal protein L23
MKQNYKDFTFVVKPVITEKSAQNGGVVLKVDARLSKTEIKRKAEIALGVKVDSIRTLRVTGKIKRSASGVGQRSNYKKVYITLPEGSKIDFLEGIE